MKFGTFIAAALLAASPVAAATVYDNGAPNAVNGNETVRWVQTEDFSFASGATLTGAGVYLAGFGGIGSWDGQFQYYLFASSSGTPGAVLQTGSASISPTDAGVGWAGGGNAYLFAFDFASAFTAAAGVTYHLGIHAGASGNFNRDDIYWVTTANNATARGIESFGGTFDNWSGNGQEHAFYLVGESGVVPEPATWAMMIAGFGMVGASLRRRAARVAA